MKGTYLLEYHHGGFFSAQTIQILDEQTSQLMYEMERDSWGKHWSVVDKCQYANEQVALAADQPQAWFSTNSVESVISLLKHQHDDGTPSTQRRANFWRENKGFLGSSQCYFLQSDDEGWYCKFTDTTSICSPTEYTISMLHNRMNSTTCTLGDITVCCGSTTFAVTFDDFGDQQFRIMFLLGCALIQHKVIQRRQQDSGAEAAAAAASS